MAFEYEDKISKLKAQLTAAVQREEEWQHRFEMLEERNNCNDLLYAEVIEKVEIEERFFQVDEEDCDCVNEAPIRERAFKTTTDSIIFDDPEGTASTTEKHPTKEGEHMLPSPVHLDVLKKMEKFMRLSNEANDSPKLEAAHDDFLQGMQNLAQNMEDENDTSDESVYGSAADTATQSEDQSDLPRATTLQNSLFMEDDDMDYDFLETTYTAIQNDDRVDVPRAIHRLEESHFLEDVQNFDVPSLVGALNNPDLFENGEVGHEPCDIILRVTSSFLHQLQNIVRDDCIGDEGFCSALFGLDGWGSSSQPEDDTDEKDGNDRARFFLRGNVLVRALEILMNERERFLNELVGLYEAENIVKHLKLCAYK